MKGDELKAAVISEVEGFACLWDLKDKRYRNQHLKSSAWEKVAEKCAVTPAEATKIWESCRRYYRQVIVFSA